MQYLPDEPILGMSIGWYGDHLQRQLNLLGTMMRPGATVLESGAGAGMHALFVAKAIGPTGHLFCTSRARQCEASSGRIWWPTVSAM